MPYADPVKQRRFNREWIAARRAEWLRANGPCRRCGGRADLQVDHIDPDSKVDHKVWSWSKERRNAELAKCQVLCYDCHEVKSAIAMRAKMKHGTASMYNRTGCRCEPCKIAKAERRRKYKVHKPLSAMG